MSSTPKAPETANSMTTVVLGVGQAIKIQLADTDGEFEIHFDSIAHPGEFVIKETAGLPGSSIGLALGILYREVFDTPDIGDEEGPI